MTNGEKFVKTFPDLARVELYRKNERATRIEFDSVWWNAEYKEPTTKNDLDFKLKDYVSREAVRRIIKSPRTQEQMLNALNSLRNATECKAEDCINRDYTAKYVEEFANNEYVSQDEAETIHLIADGIRHIPSVLPDVTDNNVGNIDCISREQAKAAIRDKFKDLPSRVEINTILNELPPITPQESRWIPVSERLPEDRREVLVTAYWHETYQVMMASYFGDGLWWCVPFNNCGEHMQRLNPKAWMPLPTAYSEVEE